MSAPLKPCPFCGEAEHLYPSYRHLGAGAPYAVDCLGCGMDFVPRDGMDVIAMWNRRVEDIPDLRAIATAARDLATYVKKSTNVGPVTKGPHKEARLWRALHAALNPQPETGLPLQSRKE